MAKKPSKSIDIKEITTKISNARKELMNLRFKKTSGQLENTSQFRKIRREVARLLTTKNKQVLKGKQDA